MAIYYRALRKHITMYVRSEIKRIYSDTSKLLTMRSHRTITNYAQYLVTWYEWIEPNERMKNDFEFFGLDCGKYLIGFDRIPFSKWKIEYSVSYVCRFVDSNSV